MSGGTESSPICGESAEHQDDAGSNADEVWPVCAGTAFNLWEPDTGDYYDSVDAEAVKAHLHKKRLSQRKTTASAFADLPKSVTDDPLTLPCLRPRVAFRNVTNPTNTRTFLCALIPERRVLTHHAPYLLQTNGRASDEAYVLGLLSSMIFDWQVRRTTEINMTFEQLNQASIPDPGEGHPVRDRVVQIAGRLGAVDERFAGWAALVDMGTSAETDDEREALLAELDACVAVLYGLDVNDVTVLCDTFATSRQWDTRRDAILDAMRRQPGPEEASVEH